MSGPLSEVILLDDMRFYISQSDYQVKELMYYYRAFRT